MKINNPDTAALAGTGRAASAAASTSSTRTQKGNGQTASDHVQLSSLGDHLRALLSDSPERAARLADLESAVASGRYRPDATAVSGSLIEQTMLAGAAA